MLLTEKRCLDCDQDLDLDLFRPERRNKTDGRAARCYSCEKTRKSEQYFSTRETRFPGRQNRRQVKTDTHKICPRCQENKPHSEFSRRKYPNGTWGIHSYCKSCAAHVSRAWYYQLSEEEYQALLEASEGRCAACGDEPQGQRGLHVDHDHKTGRVRGLLCHHCNTALGQLDDSIERLKALIIYLGGQ